ncbi:MAG TPA: citramalate synthase [Methylomusa anaerophila]|uniref:Citramalate synthase n=1 Tax=Methylomusa anaerophila TaxID=1930071 RepID=A0A348AGV1_9FIRM|nr:citramalate synthase [Methylomusa anaerophila]BBB90299.1 2-isopropylmalate synthase [Methylomusa anaerophila]HML89356.1 citramalate synthase [Methylomusa anaerophila]
MDKDKKIFIFDSTLRDGAQAQGISFSVTDKLKIAAKLDELGVSYIEAGNPGSNPKDLQFFARAKDELKFSTAKLCAFGSTRRPGIRAQDDDNLKALIAAGVDALTIFGKAWPFHVREIIKTTLNENLLMIKDSITYLKSLGKEVIFDAEHFFDGYKADPDYAVAVLRTARDAGADWLVLCDTNGGMLPLETHQIVAGLVREEGLKNLGIHCHNDAGTAVANSLVAVQAGVRQVQGTFTGFGERCGNANLSTIIADLGLKLGCHSIPGDKMDNLCAAYRYICEISNIFPNEREPYVGNCAFAHKGGMHIDGVRKNAASFEHVSPAAIGNERRILASEVSGRSTIQMIINKIDPSVSRDAPETQRILNHIKEKEFYGYQYEGAEHSLELLVRKELGRFKHSFEIVDYKVISERQSVAVPGSLPKSRIMAFVRIAVDGVVEEVGVSDEIGPVNALDKALRKALHQFYKPISQMHLADYKVRVINGENATEAKVRVLIESTDGVTTWTTIGLSDNIIEASLQALVDSYEYCLLSNNGAIRNAACQN